MNRTDTAHYMLIDTMTTEQPFKASLLLLSIIDIQSTQTQSFPPMNTDGHSVQGPTSFLS